MSNPEEGRQLHIRSLNHLSREHHFTYIGARILAESLHPSIIETWSSEYIARKARTSRRQVYWKHSLFKGFDHLGKHDYRTCVIGSPTTHLTETWLLKRLSKEKEVFGQHPNVYSYFWSHESSNQMFRYFFKGYMEREIRIAEAAAEIEEARVIVLDLKGFYPTIDVSVVKRRFADRIERSSLTSPEKDIALKCVEELTSILNVSGLPIGPSLSHLLANVYLEEVDKILSDQFDGSYFRYVDDVALVVSKSEAAEAEKFFERVVDGEGLKVNHDKTDVLTGSEWAARVRHRQKTSDDSFGRLVSDLRRYLAHNTDDFDRVRDSFREEGFALPFFRLRSVASSSKPFRRFLRSLWSQASGLFGPNIPRPPELLMRAKRLRREIEQRLRKATEKEPPFNGMARKWAIQDIRFLLNRSLYLSPPDARAEFVKLIPDCQELRPNRTVLESLVSGDASELLKFPGPTVASFCELWMESMAGRPQINWAESPHRVERDSATVLALCGLCSPPVEWTNQLHDEGSRVMVNLSSGTRPTRRSFEDFSYIDEMESLFLKPEIDVNRMMTTRFDEGEEVVLPTLSLGSSQSMS